MSESILLVDDDPRSIEVMGVLLAGRASLTFATNGVDALRLARASVPDLMLLDSDMPGMSGLDVLRAMKDDPTLSDVSVIFVTGRSGSAFEVAALELGASDFLTKPISPPLAMARINTQLKVKQLADELRVTAVTDDLTGVSNRRHFDQALAAEWLLARRTGTPLALLMTDVDHFKLFNDRYGHPGGDACLKRVADALASVILRPGDLLARYGGEEFALLLPRTDRIGAEHIAHRVLDAVEQLAIPHETSPTARHVTVSIGIASYDEQSGCWHAVPGDEGDPSADCLISDLVLASDKALYAAKRAGRAMSRFLDISDAHIAARETPDTASGTMRAGAPDPEEALHDGVACDSSP